MNEIVFRGTNDQALTNSLLIAEKFGKEHKNVMQSIRNLIGGTAENSAIAGFLGKMFDIVSKMVEYVNKK